MALKETQRNTKTAWNPVHDGRNRRVRGLWERNGIFYAQMRIKGSRHASKLRLHEAQTVAQATTALQALKVKRAENQIQARSPLKLSDAITAYTKEREQTKDKSDATNSREWSGLEFWRQFAGEVKVTKIAPKLLAEFADWRRKTHEVGGRAIDVDVFTLRHVLKQCVRDGVLRVNPVVWKRTAAPPRQVRLLTAEEVDHFCAMAIKWLRNWKQQFVDYIRFLQYSGAREQESLRLKWSDVNFGRRQITIGGDGLAKNRKRRVLDFNAKLEEHLIAMKARRREGHQEESSLLFPSPRGGGVITSYKTVLWAVRKKAKMPDVAFHHFRHYFISHAVMAGIDYLTIARWVGHQDGGILIGKIYGHINSEHSQRQAAKLSF